MVREANKLSPLKVAKLKTPGRYCYGLGLWLQVSQFGTKAATRGMVAPARWAWVPSIRFLWRKPESEHGLRVRHFWMAMTR